jgi:hypothetical protein
MSQAPKKTALHQRQAAAAYGSALGLLPRAPAGLAGTNARPQLNYYRVYVHPDTPQLLYLEAVKVHLSGLDVDPSLDEQWFTVDEQGATRPFDRFSVLSPLNRGPWMNKLVEITPKLP